MAQDEHVDLVLFPARLAHALRSAMRPAGTLELPTSWNTTQSAGRARLPPRGQIRQAGPVRGRKCPSSRAKADNIQAPQVSHEGEPLHDPPFPIGQTAMALGQAVAGRSATQRGPPLGQSATEINLTFCIADMRSQRHPRHRILERSSARPKAAGSHRSPSGYGLRGGRCGAGAPGGPKASPAAPPGVHAARPGQAFRRSTTPVVGCGARAHSSPGVFSDSRMKASA